MKYMFFALVWLLSINLSLGKPNILFAIADDWSLHAGVYGTEWVKTPHFDRVANEGLLFSNAYTPIAKCGPSRSALITGRYPWQLEQGANHLAKFPAKFKSWPETLMGKGWHVGITGKGWGPGTCFDAAGKKRLITGVPYNKIRHKPVTSSISKTNYAANFVEFLDNNPEGKPWCFWYGALEPHRGYESKSGIEKGGKKLSDIKRVPSYWPDNEVVRSDMLDYALEVEHSDKHLGMMLAELERRGVLDNTIVIVTSDHGMPFPRVKGYAYHDSNHIPLAIRWPTGIKKSNRVITDFVDLTDIAPTILDLADIPQDKSGMAPISGKSWLPIFKSEVAGRVDPNRDHTLIGKERTDVGRPNDWGYPIRGIVTDKFLWLKNYHPERWPAGNPMTGYLDTDGSPTKTMILELGRRERANKFWQLNFGKRPAEELYDITEDPDCSINLAKSPDHAAAIKQLNEKMVSVLKEQNDPRVLGNGEIFDSYHPTGNPGFYERFMSGEKLPTGWVHSTDFEKKPIK